MFFSTAKSYMGESAKKAYREKVKTYMGELRKAAQDTSYATPESALYSPDDKNAIIRVEELIKKKVTPRLRYVLVVGIGGSCLGAKAVYDALIGYGDRVEQKRTPKLLFAAETIDPEFLHKLVHLLGTLSSPEEVLINVISKSGGTPEPIVNGEIILDTLMHKFGPKIKERIVITTSAKTKLDAIAAHKHIDKLITPEQIGGRYSVLTATGLFPLGCVGVDIRSLLKGAQEIKKSCLAINDQNPSLASAFFLYHHNTKGYVINDNFFFHDELESLGKWYRQLMGESIGKEGKGIFPHVSIGSNDLHSMVQLYLGGPKNIMTSFVYTDHNTANVQIPRTCQWFESVVPNIEGRKASEVMDAIYKGVTTTYANNSMPYTETIFPEISAYSLGAYMMFKMIEIMLIAKLLGINAFGQPQVELYKIETKKILAAK